MSGGGPIYNPILRRLKEEDHALEVSLDNRYKTVSKKLYIRFVKFSVHCILIINKNMLVLLLQNKSETYVQFNFFYIFNGIEDRVY
jgi:hypothetical protein